MKTYSKEEINKARSVSIIDFCQQEGIGLIKDTNTQYRLADYHAFVINAQKNLFYVFDDSEKGGGVIDFVMENKQVNFQTALAILLNEDYKKVDLNEIQNENEPFVYYFKHQENMKNSLNYLLDQRQIDHDIVHCLLQKNLIKQDIHNNLIFVWGKNGQRVGATVQPLGKDPETGKKKRSRVAKNSEKNFGFNVSIGVPEELYIFESAVDLLSYWSLNKDLKNCMLADIEGLKPNSVYKFIEYMHVGKGILPKEIYLGVDNDRAGSRLIDQFRDMTLVNKETGEPIYFHPLVPYDSAIPTRLHSSYREILSALSSPVEWELVAAVHKAVSNFSNEYAQGNGYRFDYYFSNPVKNKNKESIDLKEVIETISNDFSGQSDLSFESIEKVVTSHSESSAQGIKMAEKIYHYYRLYKDQEYQLVETIPKDWNDVLLEQQGRARKQEQLIQKLSPQEQFEEVYMIDENKKALLKIRREEEKLVGEVKSGKKILPFFEADSFEEAIQIAKAYGFQQLDKEDQAKYFGKKTTMKTFDEKQVINR